MNIYFYIFLKIIYYYNKEKIKRMNTRPIDIEFETLEMIRIVLLIEERFWQFHFVEQILFIQTINTLFNSHTIQLLAEVPNPQ